VITNDEVAAVLSKVDSLARQLARVRNGWDLEFLRGICLLLEHRIEWATEELPTAANRKVQR